MEMNGRLWLRPFKTLLSDEKNIEIWTFMAPTFPKEFVEFVDEKIQEGRMYKGS